MELDKLIFDRTQADVSRVKELTRKMVDGTASDVERSQWLAAGMRGSWNYTDLNRIEEWTEHLAGLLRMYGYNVTIRPHAVWCMEDFPTRCEVDRIRANVEALQDGFAQLPDWRGIVYDNTVDIERANTLEWDLQRLYDWLEAMNGGFLTKQSNTIFMVAGGVFNA